MSNSNSTFKSFSTSYSSSSVNGQTTSRSETTYSDPSGTKVHRTSQEAGQAPRTEHFEVDHAGKRITDAHAEDQRRIQDVTEEEERGRGQTNQRTQAQRDAECEERMEDEYAKREGGA